MEAVVALFGSASGAVHADGMKVLSRIVTTTTEMLRDRGLVVRGEQDVLAMMEAGQPVLTSEPSSEGATSRRGVHVYFPCDAKVSVKYARAAIERAAGKSVVFVSVDGPTPFTRRECETSDVQFFTAKQLCYNVTHHALVPRHEVVDAPPTGVGVDQLPRILTTDPVVQYYAWPVGTIVRVMRSYGGSEPIPYFRLVASLPSN